MSRFPEGLKTYPLFVIWRPSSDSEGGFCWAGGTDSLEELKEWMKNQSEYAFVEVTQVLDPKYYKEEET